MNRILGWGGGAEASRRALTPIHREERRMTYCDYLCQECMEVRGRGRDRWRGRGREDGGREIERDREGGSRKEREREFGHCYVVECLVLAWFLIS